MLYLFISLCLRFDILTKNQNRTKELEKCITANVNVIHFVYFWINLGLIISFLYDVMFLDRRVL